MSEWGIAMYRDDGTQIDWNNEHATEIIDTFTLSPNTGTFSINKTYNLDAGATIGIVPSAWGALWAPENEDDSVIITQIDYSISGNTVNITFDTNQPDDGHSSEVVFPTYINIYAQYNETNYSGWGIEVPGCCFPSVNVGAKNYWLRVKDTITVTTSILNPDGHSPDDGIPGHAVFTNINGQYNIQPTDIVFFRAHDDCYTIGYDQFSGEVKMCYNEPDTDQGGYNVYPFFEGDPDVSCIVDLLIFSAGTPPQNNNWGFIVYAKDGTPAFTASSGETISSGQYVVAPTVPDGQFVEWVMSMPYGGETFIHGDLVGYDNYFIHGIMHINGEFKIGCCTTTYMEGEDSDAYPRGNGDLAGNRPIWFIDGSKYGF